jgi:hypothetical protein
MGKERGKDEILAFDITLSIDVSYANVHLQV